jgi:hypothetical protein
MQRGQLAAARAALQEIRGPLVDVEEEFDNIMHAAGVEHGQGQVCLGVGVGGGGEQGCASTCPMQCKGVLKCDPLAPPPPFHLYNPLPPPPFFFSM